MRAFLMALCGALPLAACAQAPLAGTSWQLVQIQAPSGAQGTVEVKLSSAYTLEFKADGTASARLDCNVGGGPWRTEPKPGGRAGNLVFVSWMTTAAACAPESVAHRVANAMLQVRSFALRDGRLWLSLAADAGTLVWSPLGR